MERQGGPPGGKET